MLQAYEDHYQFHYFSFTPLPHVLSLDSDYDAHDVIYTRTAQFVIFFIVYTDKTKRVTY